MATRAQGLLPSVTHDRFRLTFAFNNSNYLVAVFRLSHIAILAYQRSVVQRLRQPHVLVDKVGKHVNRTALECVYARAEGQMRLQAGINTRHDAAPGSRD